MSAVPANLNVFAELLNKSKTQFEAALPKSSGLSPEKLIRLGLTAFRKNYALQKCDPRSVVGAVMEAAQLGLEFGDLQQCALVPYKNECKLLIMYRGYLALLWRSKTITDIQAQAVYEGDDFEVLYGSHKQLMHRPRHKSNKPTHFYAGARVVGGDFIFDVMSVEQIQSHMKQYARGLDKPDSPWNTSFDAMALKTVIRRLIKLLPINSDSPVAAAIEHDDRVYDAEKVDPTKYARLVESEDLPTENDVKIATQKLQDAYVTARTEKIDISDVVKSDIKEIVGRGDVKELRALHDVISSRIPRFAAEASTYE